MHSHRVRRPRTRDPLSFSPTIVSGSDDKTARIWEMVYRNSKVIAINDGVSLNNEHGVTYDMSDAVGYLVRLVGENGGNALKKSEKSSRGLTSSSSQCQLK